MPPDYFFSKSKASPHCQVLKKLAEIIPETSKANFLSATTKKQLLVMALHIDEINIQARHTFRNNSLSGPSYNDCEKLANSMLMFLITTLAGAKRSINLYSKPVYNLNSKYLHRTLISYLSKAKECGYEVLPIIFYRASTNVKVAKEWLKQANEKNEEASSIAELKLKTNFQYKN